MTTSTASTARRSLRRIADGVLSIEIEPNNKAIVLNISDGGLGFRALNPVAQTGTIRFSFLDNGKPVEASADLVWTDPSQKNGGLSFASTPVETLERFQNWANHGRQLPRKAAASEPAVPAPTPPPVERDAYRAPSLQASAAPTPLPPPPPAPVFSPVAVPVPGPTNPRFAMLEGSVQRPDYGWYQDSAYPNPPSRFFSGFLTGVFFSIIAAALLFLAYSDSARELRTELAARIGLGGAPVPSQQAAQPAPAPAAVPPSVPSGSPAAGTAATPETPALPAPSSSGAASEPNPAAAAPETAAATSERPPASDHASPAAASVAPKVAEPGAEELARAERYLNERPGPSGAAAAAPYLWDAVKKGNLEAEITLAELYSRGEGVRKSCDQARVLLRAAAHKGSVVASDELAQLIRNGCR
jgi:hypothetical protein